MTIVIEPATTRRDEAAVRRIRRHVFQREMSIALRQSDSPDKAMALDLLAWVEPGGDPVGALTVIETSENDHLHESYGLRFGPSARVARFTQMAVLKPYRGMNIPLMLMLEAHRRFVAPLRFHYTWLLFDAERAVSSLICKMLCFTPTEHSFLSEYGLCRALVRDERSQRCIEALCQAEQYLESFSNGHMRLTAAHFCGLTRDRRRAGEIQGISWTDRSISGCR